MLRKGSEGEWWDRSVEMMKAGGSGSDLEEEGVGEGVDGRCRLLGGGGAGVELSILLLLFRAVRSLWDELDVVSTFDWPG